MHDLDSHAAYNAIYKLPKPINNLCTHARPQFTVGVNINTDLLKVTDIPINQPP